MPSSELPAGARIETAIIGAGPSGLAVARCLDALDQPWVLLDQAAAVGSTWRGHYRRLHLHTTKAYSQLPHHPMPASYPTFPARQQVVDYLVDYAATLSHPPTLSTRVLRAAREGGRWELDIQAVDAAEDGAASLSARHLVVATGYNRVPFRPVISGLDTFSGPVVHSSAYRDGAPFSGKRVLVVGCGNSGAEIAIDLWEYGAKPDLVVRGPIHVAQREVLGVPAQHTTVALRHLPPRLADRLLLPMTRYLVGDLSPWGITRPEVGPLEQIARDGRVPLIDVGTVGLITQGSIGVRRGIAHVDGDAVVFEGGARGNYGALVLATGYRAALSEVLVGAESAYDARGLPRVHGAEGAIPGLFFCGFRNPHTGALRESALEARRIAAAIAGSSHGPRRWWDPRRWPMRGLQ